MPTAKQAHEGHQGELLGLCSKAGDGKTFFALQAPQPHAFFCLDKSAISKLPDWFPKPYDSAQTFYVDYSPPDIDITKDVMDRDRSVFDQVKRDLITVKNALFKKTHEFKMRDETWPLPKTIIFEGGDFMREKLVDHYLRRHNKHEMAEFARETMTHWGNIGQEQRDLLAMLVRLPSVFSVNVIVTLGWDAETKPGTFPPERTGFFVPDFGGKLDQNGPRLFKDFWMPTAAAGKFWMVTQSVPPYDKYKGIRSGSFRSVTVEDVTLNPEKPVNQWNRLFGNNINP